MIDKREAEASLLVLIAVARADGKVTAEEQRVVDLAGEHEGRSVTFATVGEIDLDAELAKIKSNAARRLTLKAALALASVDGETSAVEHAILQRIHAALGDKAVLELRVIEDAAASRMKDVREALSRCSDDFMHALARATHGGVVDQDEYENILADLERRKHDIVEGALDQRVSRLPSPS